MPTIRLFSFFAVSAVALSSCSAPKQAVVERGTVSVKVENMPGKGVPVRVSAFAPKDGKRGPELNTYTAKDDGIVGFVLPMGQLYEFRAFADVNHNGKQDVGDPAGTIQGISPDSNIHAASAPIVLTLVNPPPGTVVPPDEPKKPAAAPVKPAIVGKKRPGKGGKNVPVAPMAAPAPTTPTAPAKPAKPSLPIPPPPPSNS